MNDYNYEIGLRPLEHYFFGGERTFGTAGSEQSNYFAVSNLYPQQTALLGLLRYLLLEQNDCLPLKRHRARAEALIGSASFDVKQQGMQSFGVIKALSTLLLKKEDAYYRLGESLAPGALTFCEDKGEVMTQAGVSSALPEMADYDAKKGLAFCAIPLKGGAPVALDKIFLEQIQVGILKASTEDGFFKQRAYRLQEGWSFCIQARLQGDFKLHNGLVKFGADQKQFSVTVQSNPTQPDWSDQEEECTRLTLLSDALVDPEIYEHCQLAISTTVDFRTVRMAHGSQGFERDEVKHNLLRRGSMLFAKADQMPLVETALQANENFRNIGFNQYFKSKR